MSISDLLFKSRTPLSKDELNRRVQIIHNRLVALENLEIGWKEEVNNLRGVGLERINTALRPAYEAILELADLGALLSASTVSEVDVSSADKSFFLTSPDKERFAPPAFMYIAANVDRSNYLITELIGYDRSSGRLDVRVIRYSGSGTYDDWIIAPVATTDDLENLRQQVEQFWSDAKDEADRAVDHAGIATSAKDEAQTARDEAQAARDVTLNARDDVATDRTATEQARDDAVQTLASKAPINSPEFTGAGLSWGPSRVPSGTSNWNDVTTSGFWIGNDFANAPFSGSWAYVLVQRYSSSYVVQTCWDLTGSTHAQMWVRRLNNGTWIPWEEVITTAHTSVHGRSLIAAADYDAMRALLDADGNLHRMSVITYSRTFQFFADTKLALVEVIGGGGGGAGSNSGDNGSPRVAHAGGGGGAGGRAISLFDVSGIANKQATLTIGAGGSGGSGATSPGSDGGDGGTSTYTDSLRTFSASGGFGGRAFAATTLVSASPGGGGGVGTSGQINHRGVPGDAGFFFGELGAGGNVALAVGGSGGSSAYGAGGRHQFTRSYSAAGVDGNDGEGYGAGGSGASRVASLLGNDGGAGSPGLIIIKEYR